MRPVRRQKNDSGRRNSPHRKYQRVELADGSHLDYWPSFFSHAESFSLFMDLKHEVQWARRQVKVFGKVHDQPRLVAMHGDPGISYEYSNQVIVAEPWTPAVLAVKEAVERATVGHVFNGCLLNRYDDGRHCMGAHSDNERSISGYVASVSFGAERDFVMRRKASGKGRSNNADKASNNMVVDNAMGTVASRTMSGSGDAAVGENIAGEDSSGDQAGKVMLPNSAASRSKQGSAGPVRQVLTLKNGSLLIMTPAFQQNWTHELPRRATCRDMRINLTFREFL